MIIHLKLFQLSKVLYFVYKVLSIIAIILIVIVVIIIIIITDHWKCICASSKFIEFSTQVTNTILSFSKTLRNKMPL